MNRYFIKECLEGIIENLTACYKPEVEFELDHDTKNVSGYPNITKAIQTKMIREYDIYVGGLAVKMKLVTNRL